MITFETDLDKNILFANLSGVISAEEATKFLKDLDEIASTLEPSFTVVNDISGLRIFDPSYTKVLEKAHLIMAKHKMGRVIRVVGNAKDTLFKFAKFDSEAKYMNGEFVPDMESAMKLIADQ